MLMNENNEISDITSSFGIFTLFFYQTSDITSDPAPVSSLYRGFTAPVLISASGMPDPPPPLQGEVPPLTFADSGHLQKPGQCAKYTVTKSCTDTSVGYEVIPKI